ncbi:MAG: ATPase [Bacteroidota bacterium]
MSGVCLMCKERIENAALIKGVKFAEWDLDSGILKVVYKDWKTSESAIHEALAEQGHETEKVKCTDEQYGQLHACCRYRSVDGEQ